MAEDYYRTLGIERGATADEVKKAYRKLARKFHPDVNPGNPEAEAKFKEIQEAYGVLSDEDKRKQYDTFGRVDGAGEPGSDPFRGAAGAWREAGPFGGGYRVEYGPGGEAFGGEDLSDLFGQIFGGMGRGRRGRPRARRGADQEVRVELSLEDAVRGTTVTMPVQREVPCSACGGDGNLDGRVCPSCRGAGRVVTTERLKVRLPAGVHDGARVRAAGKGGAGVAGGSAGDLFVRVHVRPHPFFRRDGDDIRTEVPITVDEAYLGAEIEVGTIHGPVRAKVPPGTSSGTVFRLRGKGVHDARRSRTGDHLYAVRVTTPERVTEEGRGAAQTLRDLYDASPREGLPRSL